MGVGKAYIYYITKSERGSFRELNADISSPKIGVAAIRTSI